MSRDQHPNRRRRSHRDAPASSSSSTSTDVTTCVFDIFFDIPHPAASPTCERAKIIEPPGRIHPGISELYDPSNVSRIPKFAFPDYDEQTDIETKQFESTSAILNKHDVCCFASKPIHHTFSLLLDSGTRVYAHVLRYLPIHSAVQTRYDIGRRGERAMVLITRAVGGTSFYASLLKTLQAISMEAIALPPTYVGNHDLVKSFLHSMYKKHLVMKNKYNERGKKHGFQKVLSDAETKIAIHGAELYFLLPPSTTPERRKSGGSSVSGTDMQMFKKHDHITFHLPNSLQPGYRGNEHEIEGSGSAILPLFRCLGSAKTIRLLSALLCEHRVIFVSKNIEILSACINACTAMLAQGLLIWRHVQIPVLPPHLLRYLSTSAPFIVGVLDKYAERVEKMPGLKEALYIDLDQGLLKTLNMKDAQTKVPDLLLRKRRKNNVAVEEAAKLVTSVVDDERLTWDFVDLSEKKADDDDDSTRKKSLTEKIWSTKSTTKKEKLDKANGDFFKQAEIFVRSILPQSVAPSDVYKSPDEDNSPMYSRGVSTQRFRAYILSENERGEEVARASLVCLFLELFGDMGMYLTVDQSQRGSFRLDVKKFLARKRQLGAKEDTALFLLLQRLTRSAMFVRFTESRISDIENSSGQIIISHTSLFSLCQNHMRSNKTEFTTQNIRKVVFTTISACPDRRRIDGREEVKDRALALTCDKPFEGDEVMALTALISICKECDRSFVQVMQVIWLRIRDDRPLFWKHLLLGLHLLRNFLLHGPITTVSFSIGELERIRELMEYKGKFEEISTKVQSSAKQVYALLKNICRLFLRRRKVVTQQFERTVTVSDTVRWSNYLVRRLPTTVRFEQLHVLMKPGDDTIPVEKVTEKPLHKDNFTAINTAHFTDVALKSGKTGNGTYDNIPIRIKQKIEPPKTPSLNSSMKSTAAFTDVALKSGRAGKAGNDHFSSIPFDIKPSSLDPVEDLDENDGMAPRRISPSHHGRPQDRHNRNQHQHESVDNSRRDSIHHRDPSRMQPQDYRGYREEKSNERHRRDHSKENLSNHCDRKQNRMEVEVNGYRTNYRGVENVHYEAGLEEVKF
mmetsp:Transcript_11612/g.17596  ORF Transcript_11612/g.17596 Transcript_11612/m.17596 type:complete len:1079 (+) Transcript_11612:370-3606(+)